jgi:hypothetical protein
MLHQAMDALRRWFSRPPAPGCAVAVDVDRRLYVRRLASMQATCRPADDIDHSSFIARVRDISRSGVGLLLPGPIDSGTLLSIDFPAIEGRAPYTVLATVLHVASVPNGEWAAGCVFACELSEDDVQSFVSQHRPAGAPEQRQRLRFPCVARAFFREVGETEAPSEPVRVLDLSPCGIGMLATRPLSVGTLLSLELSGVRDDSMLTILATVARTELAAESEWMIGCTFSRELTDPELRTLL